MDFDPMKWNFSDSVRYVRYELESFSYFHYADIQGGPQNGTIFCMP